MSAALASGVHLSRARNAQFQRLLLDRRDGQRATDQDHTVELRGFELLTTSTPWAFLTPSRQLSTATTSAAGSCRDPYPMAAR